MDRLLDSGHDPSTIRNTLMPVRAIFRRALAPGEVAINPTTGLELPAVRGRRDRIASPDEPARLLAALDRDRALWATAMYAGLRLGELLALEWSAVDLDAGLLHVRRSWDPKAGPVAPKSRAGLRSVPVPQVLRTQLAERRLACRWSDDLIFGRTPDVPFLAKTPNDRAQRAWRKAQLTPIGLDECLHGPLERDDHLRPLRAPHAGRRGRGGGAAGRVSAADRRIVARLGDSADANPDGQLGLRLEQGIQVDVLALLNLTAALRPLNGEALATPAATSAAPLIEAAVLRSARYGRPSGR